MTSLKYAHVERERRWLLASVPDTAGSRVLRIVDRYVAGTRLRLRETTAADGTVVRKLGHKVRIGEGAREVAHTSLYLDDAEWDLLAALPARTLTKTRTLVPVAGRARRRRRPRRRPRRRRDRRRGRAARRLARSSARSPTTRPTPGASSPVEARSV